MMFGEQDEAELDAAEARETQAVAAARASVVAQLPALKTLLPNEADVEVRRALPSLLAACADNDSVLLLARLATDDTDDLVRTSAIFALGLLEYPLPASDPATVVRLAAGVVGADSDAIVRELEGLDRLEALEAWTENGPVALVLHTLRRDPHAQLRVLGHLTHRLDAIYAAGDLATTWRSATEPVVELATDALADRCTASGAASVLSGLAPLSAPAADALLQAAKLPDARESAVLALARLKDLRALELIDITQYSGRVALQALGRSALSLRERVIAHLQHDEYLAVWLGDLGPDAEPAVPLLARMADQGKLAAAAALGRIGVAARSARPTLQRLLHAQDDQVRVHAAIALMHIDGDAGPLNAETTRLLAQPRRGALLHSLDALPAPGPDLAPLFHHADEWVRMPAARAHWRLTGDHETAAPVLVALAGPSPVGMEALETLAAMPRAASAPLHQQLRGWRDTDLRPEQISYPDEAVARDLRLIELCETLLHPPS